MKLAIIPIKERSNRLPKKNYFNFFGKPIFTYIYNEAIKSKLFDKVIISTDSKYVIDYCKNKKINDLVIRPKYLSNKLSTLDQVILYTFKKLGIAKAQYFCLLWATSPMTSHKDLIKSYNLIKNKKSTEGCIGCIKDYSLYSSLKKNTNSVYYSPVYNSKKISKLSKQLIEPNYLINSSLAWVKFDSFLRNQSWILKNTIPYPMPYYKSVDLDYPKDFELLKFYYKRYKNKI